MNLVITGSTKGIGKAIVDAFAPKALQVFLTSRHLEDLKAQKLELETRYPHLKVLIKTSDFSDPKEVASFATFISSNTNCIDVLVNNAGVFIPGNLMDEEEGKLETMMQINLFSVYHLTRSIVPLMNTSAKPHIFNLCSVAGIKAYPNGGSYSITKYALMGLTANLRHELTDKDIRVTAVIPGATWSDSWKGVELPYDRLMEANDISTSILNAYELSRQAVVETIILRPQLGDL